MRKYLIATHGLMGKGIVNTLEMIIGPQENVSYVAAYTEECKDPAIALKDFIDENEDKDIVILTDLYGGSVNNIAMPFVKKDNVYLVTGINLALIIEIVMSDSEDNTNEVIQNAISSAKDAIQYLGDIVVAEDETDDEF